MERSAKVKYPSAIKKRVKGDWNCENCTNLNFSFRNSCNLCGHGKNSPALFSCALYFDIDTMNNAYKSPFSNTNKQELNSLPSVSAFFEMNFLQKPSEVYPLTERHFHQ